MISSEILEFEKIENPASKSLICSEILNDLPLWFGIPESNKEYEIEVKSKPFFAISLNKEIIGFLSVKRNNAYVLELYVLGIKEKYHRKGIGSMLIDFIEEYAINNNYQYLEVKTLDESRKSKEYEKNQNVLSKLWFHSYRCIRK